VCFRLVLLLLLLLLSLTGLTVDKVFKGSNSYARQYREKLQGARAGAVLLLLSSVAGFAIFLTVTLKPSLPQWLTYTGAGVLFFSGMSHCSSLFPPFVSTLRTRCIAPSSPSVCAPMWPCRCSHAGVASSSVSVCVCPKSFCGDCTIASAVIMGWAAIGAYSAFIARLEKDTRLDRNRDIDRVFVGGEWRVLLR
jgi:hypothetical protein